MLKKSNEGSLGIKLIGFRKRCTKSHQEFYNGILPLLLGSTFALAEMEVCRNTKECRIAIEVRYRS